MHDNFIKNEKIEVVLMRLQKYLAKCGVASRRASEEIILNCRVSVNGKIVCELGTKVNPLVDEVCVDGEKVSLEEVKRYVLLNKPEGLVCSSSDEKGRDVAADLLKTRYDERLYNVGRLDMYSCGLILFTNDGDFAKVVSHPSSNIEKEYVVETNKTIPSFLIEGFSKGIRVEDVFYKARSIEQKNARKVHIVLVEGKNREIRRVFKHFDIGITKLERIRIGTIVGKNISAGEFRELSKAEIEGLLSVCNQ